MVFSELLYKIPYSIAWRLANIQNYSFPVIFYCSDFIDYVLFAPILKHLPDITIVARNRTVQNQLFEKGISSIMLPAFPKVAIMARHAFHKFPSKKVKKIGLRHGAYNFKGFIDAKKYNRFDLFLFTSKTELKEANEFGIKCGASVGFPKIDALHNNSIYDEELNKIRYDLKLDKDKPTILFSATWDKSRLSAIDRWYNKLDSISEKYNILVTLHSQISKKYINVIKQNPKINFISEKDINPYLLIADVLVADTSSIIAEFCSLNKPIITFKIKSVGRLKEKIVNMLDEISFRVTSFYELDDQIQFALKNKEIHSENRKKYNQIFFDKLDGKASERAAEEIAKYLNSQQISF